MSIRTDLMDVKIAFQSFYAEVQSGSFGRRAEDVEAAMRIVVGELNKGRRLVQAAAEFHKIDAAEDAKALAEARLQELREVES